MKRIKNFSNYKNISESKVYFMNDLLYKLRELVDLNSDEWANKLLKAQGNNIDSDVTFLELDGDNFSFSKEGDIKSVLNKMIDINDIDDFFGKTNYKPVIKNYLGKYEQDNIKELKNRGRVKMGKVIKKLIPEIPDKDLENLVNSLKSEQSGYNIKLVKGKDILKYYKTESCDPNLLKYGSLRNSCMMDMESKKPHIFDVYSKNPEKCQLAVMLNNSGQLVGRALVWKIDEITKKSYDEEINKMDNGFFSNLDIKWKVNKFEDTSIYNGVTNNLFYMDRVYYTKDWIDTAFKKWAKDNNMMIKNGFSIKYQNNYSNFKLSININKIAYRKFPYMDTFLNYEVQSGKLSNDIYRMNRTFRLNSSSGDYWSEGKPKEILIDKSTNYIRRFKDYFK
jgi:hypothetical protein